jgi:FKBP-type peptidyl-prolyl cis-trans isomerase
MVQFLKAARKKYGLQFSKSGLGYSISGGRGGERPRPVDSVVVSCGVSAADGTTRLRQLEVNHLRVKVSDLLPGLEEGTQMMTIGAQAVFVLPPILSFGSGSWPDGVESGAPLIYYVTLHEVDPAPGQ